MQETVETTSSITNEKILISLFSIVNEGKCSNHTTLDPRTEKLVCADQEIRSILEIGKNAFTCIY